MASPGIVARNRANAAAGRARARARDAMARRLLAIANEEVARRAVVPGLHPMHVARYVTVTEGGVGVMSVARIAGRQLRQVTKSVRRVEDLRDDPEIDARLEQLGARVRRRWEQGGASCAS